MTSPEPLLAVRDLCGGYGDVPVLHDVSVEVYSGETVAMLGPNGHGKTTLLRTVSGLHKASSGEIRFDGSDISRLSPNRIAARGLVHVPQGDLLFGDMTVIENLLVGAYLLSAWSKRRERMEMIWEIFPELRLRRDSMTRNLSGGERRMTALGRAMMGNAKLLMIDEPSLGLAPIAIQNLYEALDSLKETGITILLVEEAAERVSGVAERLYLLDSGRIVREGPAEDILRDRTMLETYLG